MMYEFTIQIFSPGGEDDFWSFGKLYFTICDKKYESWYLKKFT